MHATTRAFLCFLGAAVSIAQAQAPSPSPEAATARPPAAAELRRPLAEIDALVADAFARRPVGSVTVGVVSGAQLIWSKSYGDADSEKQTPATADTVYRIGSITKMFTAIMLHQLVESGKVHLSDPAETYFSELKSVQGRFVDAPPVTLVQLATHTSGLSREPDDLPTYLKGPGRESSRPWG
jgi:CubicO group peptidase (beta-lactamase class C family)